MGVDANSAQKQQKVFLFLILRFVLFVVPFKL